MADEQREDVIVKSLAQVMGVNPVGLDLERFMALADHVEHRLSIPCRLSACVVSKARLNPFEGTLYPKPRSQFNSILDEAPGTPFLFRYGKDMVVSMKSDSTAAFSRWREAAGTPKYAIGYHPSLGCFFSAFLDSFVIDGP